jgi:K+-transporting ATPase ATPase C chain
MAILRPAILTLLLLTIVTGGLYPLATTLLGQWWFPAQAGGSLITRDGEVLGSALIGQPFHQARYFQGRPSAGSGDPMASGGSNLAPGNPELDKQFAERIAALRAANPQASRQVPVELVTASGSGLDGQLSPAAIAWQIPRVARERGLTAEQLTRLVAQNTETPLPGFPGLPVVNILKLNLALDALRSK